MAGERFVAVRARRRGRVFRDPNLSPLVTLDRKKEWDDAKWRLGWCVHCQGGRQDTDVWTSRFHPRVKKWLCKSCFLLT